MGRGEMSSGLTRISSSGIIAGFCDLVRVSNRTATAEDNGDRQPSRAVGFARPRMTLVPFHTAVHGIGHPEGWKTFDMGIRTP